jgi:hypothetical protein
MRRGHAYMDVEIRSASSTEIRIDVVNVQKRSGSFHKALAPYCVRILRLQEATLGLAPFAYVFVKLPCRGLKLNERSFSLDSGQVVQAKSARGRTILFLRINNARHVHVYRLASIAMNGSGYSSACICKPRRNCADRRDGNGSQQYASSLLHVRITCARALAQHLPRILRLLGREHHGERSWPLVTSKSITRQQMELNCNLKRFL